MRVTYLEQFIIFYNWGALPMDDFPILTTERLLLRALSADDAADLFAVHSDAEDLLKIFDNCWLTGTGLRWAIERRLDHTFLGTCGLFKWNRGWRSCSIGYELAPFARGQGYMQEALGAAIAYGFDSMQVNRIEAQVHTQNAASIKTLKAMGFVHEGLQRQAGYWHGTYHDLHQFALIYLDYQNQKNTTLKINI